MPTAKAVRLELPGNPPADLHFLQGGGEMGARMRALDWTRTPLGSPASWPQSLKTIVRVMLDSRYAMWMLWGPGMTFFCNDAYLPTVGIKRDWVLGARADKVWEEIWPDIGPRIEHVRRHGEATWDEGLQLFLERSGYPEETYHTFSYSPVYDDQSRVAGMLCVVTEVTERVIGERRLRVLGELASCAVGVQGVGEGCARACAVLARYPLDVPFAALYLAEGDGRAARRVAWAGESTAVVLPERLCIEDAASPWALQRALSSENAVLVDDLPRHGISLAAGPWRDRVKQALVLPLKSAGTGGAGVLIAGCSPRRALDEPYRAFLDLVANQVASAIADAQAYEAERHRAETLAELDRAKTAFFSNVSHEFRTPLTLMLGPLDEALREEGVQPAVRQRLELAQRNAVRLQRLVTSLLDFSRIEAGRAQASYEPTDLAALTRDLGSTFRSAMDKAGLAYAVDCQPLAETAYVDRGMWEKIVLNLLSNAFKFTLEGGVALRLHADGNYAVLEVADTGIGVPAQELPRLFERFHRVEGARARTQEGSGIGLALVHELVKLHGGGIDASSVLGRGTTFRVRLPLGHDHLPAERIKDGRSGGMPLAEARSFVDEALRWLPESDQSLSAPMPLLEAEAPLAVDRRFAASYGARIVLADDNADMRGYLRDLLAPYYAVEAVPDGAQALAAARRLRPELILSDVMMPRLNGFELLAAVRADAGLRDVPVVLLSARAGEEARIEGLDSGADDYLIKPFSARELLARLGALLELRRMRRAADEAFRLRTSQFETLLNEAPLGVYLVDADFRIREVNPTACVTFGDRPGLIGSDFGELCHRLWPPHYADELVRLFRHTLDTGEPHVASERIAERLDRRATEYYEWQISRIPLPDGRFGVVCYFREISVQVRARAQLEAADRQKDEFLAMLAHELRNPLAPIRNAGEILSRLCVGEGRAEQAVRIVQRQVSNLTRLVDDLLDVSRITQGRVALQWQSVPLADLVTHALETVEPLMKDKGHELSVAMYRSLRVRGDPARLVQCLGNLLNNAAKYTDRGGRIRLEVRDDGRHAQIIVSDNGIGIVPELQTRVFDLFVQGDRTLDRAQGGLGIGLSVVKRLVEMHGGSVSLFSQGAGQGSRFEIQLPLLHRDEAETDHGAPPPTPSRRILVVDDNVDAANSLAIMLGLEGHRVECAYTAHDALERAQAARPDVALLDIGLPGMDGYELARRLRAQPGLADTRLIALSGYGHAEDMSRARASGFDAHLVKPADLRVLQAVLAGGADAADATTTTSSRS